MAETIRRAPHDADNPYFMMRRSSAQDRRLSYESRGVLAYLLSKPTDWEIQVPDLMQGKNKGEGHEPEASCGRDQVYRIIKELMAAGYMDREILFGDTLYIVYEAPPVQRPENQYTGNQCPEKPQLHNTEEEQSIEQDGSNAAPAAPSQSSRSIGPIPNPRAISSQWSDSADDPEVEAPEVKIKYVASKLESTIARLLHCRGGVLPVKTAPKLDSPPPPSHFGGVAMPSLREAFEANPMEFVEWMMGQHADWINRGGTDPDHFINRLRGYRNYDPRASVAQAQQVSEPVKNPERPAFVVRQGYLEHSSGAFWPRTDVQEIDGVWCDSNGKPLL